MGEFAIGQSVPRFEDPRLLRGGGRYVDDIALPGMAYRRVLRSPHAHASIRSIDTAKAKAAPGVLAVLTGADWQASGWGDLPVPAGSSAATAARSSRPIPALVKDEVRWVGDYVAFVVAETLHQAHRCRRADRGRLRAAAGRDLDRATRPRPVRRGCGTTARTISASSSCSATRPRPTPAFAKADHVVKHRFVINRVTAATMEPRGCVGDYNPADGRYTVYTDLAARASATAPSWRRS